MEKKKLLFVIAIVVVLILAVALLLNQTGGQILNGSTKKYSAVTCNQTAFACAQEKLRDSTFDCTDLCKEVCSAEMLEKCIYGDFS
jgi:hypothetical protein